MKGFSLLEALLVIAIIAVLSVTGIGYYRNYVKSVELDSLAAAMVADLKTARSKAMSGEESLKWGARFINGADDYYELFSTPINYQNASTSVKSATYLSGGVVFTNPPSASSTDVIFNKITGTATATSITISFEENSKTINIGSNGNIY